MSKLKNLIERVVKEELDEVRIRNYTDIKFMREITKVLNRHGSYAEFSKNDGNIIVKRGKNDDYYIKLGYKHRIDPDFQIKH